MRIRITMTLDEGYADPEHEMGMSEAAYLEISGVLAEYGYDIEIERVAE